MNLTASNLGAIAAVGAVLITIFSGYVMVHIRLKALEIEVKQLQKNQDATDEKFEKIMDKLSLVHQNFNDLLLEFANLKK